MTMIGKPLDLGRDSAMEHLTVLINQGVQLLRDTAVWLQAIDPIITPP
jgi:hypothetical protein